MAVRLLAPSEVEALRAQPSARTAALRFGNIDFGRPFVPETFTQLYYTPEYARLPLAQRLRYNQLFALRINEQVMVFERALGAHMLARLVGHPALDPELSACVAHMVEEEDEHYALFRDLNRACLPEVYARTDVYFTRMRRLDRALLWLLGRAPYRVPVLLWFGLALEEYALGLARACAEDDGSGPLGPIEPQFVRVHAEHARDEQRHVHVGAQLLRTCFHAGALPKRRLCAALLRAFLRDAVVPRRSGAAVVRHWISEFPELCGRELEFTRALVALKDDERFQRSLFNRWLMPVTFALFDEDRVFVSLAAVMKGYDRRSPG